MNPIDIYKGSMKIAFAICFLMFILLGLFPISPIAAYFVSFIIVAVYTLIREFI